MKNTDGQEIRKCGTCGSTKLLEQYFSKNKKGEYKKTCDKCLEKGKKQRNDPKYKEYQKNYHKKHYENNKNERKDYQVKYSEDNKEELKEQQKCEHNINKYYCKICSDPIKVTIARWISKSRSTDKKYNRYDPVKFIDTDFLTGLVEDSDLKCVYCKCDMHFEERDKNLCTIERVDNELGHNKDNVTLACWGCNCERSQRLTFEEFIAIKQLQITKD